jgi:hypothetical protein
VGQPSFLNLLFLWFCGTRTFTLQSRSILRYDLDSEIGAEPCQGHTRFQLSPNMAISPLSAHQCPRVHGINPDVVGNVQVP